MKGQWISIYGGLGRATWAIVDIDEKPRNFVGHLSLYSDPLEPVISLRFATDSKDAAEYVVTAKVEAFQYQGERSLPLEALRSSWPGWIFPEFVELTLSKVESGLRVRWAASGLGHDEIIAPDSRAHLDSELEALATVTDWASFKGYVNGALQDRRFFFRGQARARWRLRTSFHRAGRFDLGRYFITDVPIALQALTPLLQRSFHLENPVDHASFLHLLQHHGYPTPLLDWSLSPYVAAYFAFKQRRNEPANDERVRIHIFDPYGWQERFERSQSLSHVGPFLGPLVAVPIANPRARPQQSVSTMTNVDDIEAFVAKREVELDFEALWAIDLPYSERDKVLRDLRRMGLTAESLFPGLDGACEALSIEHFDLDD